MTNPMQSEHKAMVWVFGFFTLLIILAGGAGFECSNRDRACRAEVYTKCVADHRNECAESASRTCNDARPNR